MTYEEPRLTEEERAAKNALSLSERFETVLIDLRANPIKGHITSEDLTISYLGYRAAVYGRSEKPKMKEVLLLSNIHVLYLLELCRRCSGLDYVVIKEFIALSEKPEASE